MSVRKCIKRLNCFTMHVEEGQIENEYDFAEDAMDFETQLAEAHDVTYTQALSEPLAVGSYIVCTGTPNDDIAWFSINIGSGSAESGKADIAVHFNVRMPQCYVVRNSRRGERWGVEETTSFRMFPFKVGRPFTIEALIDEKESLWAVDGEHYCGYAHRLPAPFTATWVQVTGLKDATLDVKRTEVYPVFAPPSLEVPTALSYESPRSESEPEWRRNIVATLSNGIPEGYQLVLFGRLRPLLHSFTFDLVDGLQEWPRANIPLHVNLRAHVHSDLPRQLLVLNAWRAPGAGGAGAGGWGAERRQRTARLIPNTQCTFRIVRGGAEWSVFADNLLIGELEHRSSADEVKAVRIRGDFYPERIYLCPVSASPLQPDHTNC